MVPHRKMLELALNGRRLGCHRRKGRTGGFGRRSLAVAAVAAGSSSWPWRPQVEGITLLRSLTTFLGVVMPWNGVVRNEM